MYLDLTPHSNVVEIVIFWRILYNSQVYFTKYIQMFITSEQIIAQVSAKKRNAVFLMYFMKRLHFFLSTKILIVKNHEERWLFGFLFCHCYVLRSLACSYQRCLSKLQWKRQKNQAFSSFIAPRPVRSRSLSKKGGECAKDCAQETANQVKACAE